MKIDQPPHAKRRGWLRNGNQPGDLSKVPQCGAKTRKGKPYKAPAMTNGRCKMHGGTSPGGPVGNQHALNHGLRRTSAIEERKRINRGRIERCQDCRAQQVDQYANEYVNEKRSMRNEMNRYYSINTFLKLYN